MIIDVHGHWGPWFFTSDVGDVATNLAVLERYTIDLQLVSAVEAVVYDAPAGNAALDAVLAGGAGGGRLAGLVVVDPRRPGDAVADLDRLLPTGRWLGAKVHTHYSGTPIASPAMHAVLAEVAARDVPVLVHTWGDDVLDLAETCAALPDLRAVAGHMGGPGWRHAPEAVAGCDRLWLEPSWSQPEAGRLRWVLDRVPVERMLFGTDATLIDPAVALGAVAGAHLTPAEAERVLWRNAADLFRLDLDVHR